MQGHSGSTAAKPGHPFGVRRAEDFRTIELRPKTRRATPVVRQASQPGALSPRVLRTVSSPSQLDADRCLAVLVDEGGEPGTRVEQRLTNRIGRPAVVEVGSDQQAARPQQATQLRMQLRDRRRSVEKCQVVTGLKSR